MPRKMAGRLRHRVTLEAPVETDDGAGGVILNWSAILSLWAEVRVVSGSEQLVFGRSHAARMTKVIVRYRHDITNDMRFRFGTRIMEIRQVADPEGLKQWLECICEERPQ